MRWYTQCGYSVVQYGRSAYHALRAYYTLWHHVSPDAASPNTFLWVDNASMVPTSPPVFSSTPVSALPSPLETKHWSGLPRPWALSVDRTIGRIFRRTRASG